MQREEETNQEDNREQFLGGGAGRVAWHCTVLIGIDLCLDFDDLQFLCGDIVLLGL